MKAEFDSIDGFRALCTGLPRGDLAAEAASRARLDQLTKPPGSLGRLEDAVAHLARWQSRERPRLSRVEVLIFAGNHGVTARGVSPYPAAVTAQMVANFAAGGAAICQLARAAGASLKVVPLSLDRPTADFTTEPALDEPAFVACLRAGWDALPGQADLVCLGEMGIGNTTVAAALAAALFGGTGADWAGRGTGIDDDGLTRKQAAVDAGLARHQAAKTDPLLAARLLGGRELAALLGACLRARLLGIPVVLDGFVATASVAPLARLVPDGLAHALLGHASAEAGHARLAAALGLTPLLDLGMRLGEGSGAAVAVGVLRAGLACYDGMATFAEAGVTDKV